MKHFNVVLVFAVFSALVISGCGGKKTETTEGVTVIRVAMGGLPGEAGSKVEIKLAEAFEKQNPDVKIEWLWIDWNGYQSKLLAMIASGDVTDMFFINSIQYYEYADRGLLLPVDEYAKRDKYDLNDYYPNLLGIAKYKDKLYGLPRDFSPIVLFYNRDIFDRAKIKYPDSTWTWDTLKDVAGKLTRDLNGDGRIDEYGLLPGFLSCYVFQNKGDYTDSIISPARSTINSPAVKGAYEYLRQLQQATGSKSGAGGQTVGSGAKFSDLGFETGKIAMSQGGTFMFPQFVKTCSKFNWDIAELPKGKSRATIYGCAFWSIYANSKKADVCWRFMKYWCGPEGQKIAAERITPALKSIVNSEWYLTQDSPKNRDVIPKSQQYARPHMCISPRSLRIGSVISETEDEVLSTNRPIDDIVKKADERINAILREK